jgi:hypothetical protein
MKKLIRISALLMLPFAGGCAQFSSTPVATAQVYNPVDSYQEYVQRSDKVTLSAGNAQEVNTRIQEIDPWPRNVGDTRIAVNGEIMANAVYRYRCEKGAPPALQGITTASSIGGGGGGGGSTTGGGDAAPPNSECGGGGRGGGQPQR